MSIGSYWTAVGSQQFVEELSKTAESMKEAGKPHSYLHIGYYITYSVDKKYKASSFKKILQAVEDIDRSDNLREQDNIKLRQSLKTITERFKEKPAAWYYKIPIISSIYAWKKNKLIERANALCTELQSHYKAKIYKEAGPDQNFVDSKEKAVEFLQDKPLGTSCIWVEADGTLGALTKTPFKNVHAEDAIYKKPEMDSVLFSLRDLYKDLTKLSNVLKKQGLYAESPKEAMSMLSMLEPGALRVTDHEVFVKIPGLEGSSSSIVRFDYYFKDASSLEKCAQLLDPKNCLDLLQKGKIYQPYLSETLVTSEFFSPFKALAPESYLLIKDPDSDKQLIFFQKMPAGFSPPLRRVAIPKDSDLFKNLTNCLSDSKKYITEHFHEALKPVTVANFEEAQEALSKATHGTYKVWKEEGRLAYLQKRPFEKVTKETVRYISDTESIADKVRDWNSYEAMENYFTSKNMFVNSSYDPQHFKDKPARSVLLFPLDYLPQEGVEIGIKLPSWSNDTCMRVAIYSKEDYFANIGDTCALLRDNPLELMKREGLFYDDATKMDAKFIVRNHLNRHGKYVVFQDPQNPAKLQLMQVFMSPEYGIKIEVRSFNRGPNFFEELQKALNESDRIENELRAKAAKGESAGPTKKTTSTYASKVEKMSEAKKAFLEEISITEELSFYAANKQRRKWFATTGHADKGGDLAKNKAATVRWEELVASIQENYKNTIISDDLLERLDRYVIEDSKEKLVKALDSGLDPKKITYAELWDLKAKAQMTGSVKDQWDIFVKAVQVHYKSQEVTKSLLQELDTSS